MYKCVLFAHWWFLFRPRVSPRVLGSVARRKPARTPRRKCGPWPRSVARALGVKVASDHGEAFRARRAIQAQSNPCTEMSDGSCDILNLECRQCRQAILDDGKVFPQQQLARHATTFSTTRYNLHGLGSMSLFTHDLARKI